MRKVTNVVVGSFNMGRAAKLSNTETDGNSLWLFGNKIAEYRNGNIWITNAGWSTNTTKERLNAVKGVNISQKNGTWYLNGKEWNGEWTNVNNPGEVAKEENPFKSLLMVAKIGEILTDNKEDQNKWKKRMIKAQFGEGANFPDNWDQLSEDEKERRLNGALDQLK